VVKCQYIVGWQALTPVYMLGSLLYSYYVPFYKQYVAML